MSVTANQRPAPLIPASIGNPAYVAKRFHQSDTMNFWKAPEVTYETVKKMSEQPSPVSTPNQVTHISIPEKSYSTPSNRTYIWWTSESQTK